MNKIILLSFWLFSAGLSHSQGNPIYRIIIFDFDSSERLLKSDGIDVSKSIQAVLASFTKSNKNIEILEREKIAEMYADRSSAQKLPMIYDEKSAVKIGRLLEANFVIFGRVVTPSFVKGVKINARLVDVETGSLKSYESNLEDSTLTSYDNAVRKLVIGLFDGSLLSTEVQFFNQKRRDDMKEVLLSYKKAGHLIYLPSDDKFDDTLSIAKSGNVISGEIIGLYYFSCYDQDIDGLISFDSIIFIFTTNGFYWIVDQGFDFGKSTGYMDWIEFATAKIKFEDHKAIRQSLVFNPEPEIYKFICINDNILLSKTGSGCNQKKIEQSSFKDLLLKIQRIFQ
jgi:hypothetical protein